MLSQQVNVTWIQLFRPLEIRVARVPLALPAGDIGERLIDPAAVREKMTSLLKIISGGIVFLENRVVVISFGIKRFAEIGLKLQGGFSCLARLFPKAGRRLQVNGQKTASINVR